MKLLSIITLSFVSANLFGQTIPGIELRHLPKGITYSGNPVEVRSWKDISGEHHIIITENSSGSFFSKNWSSELIAQKWTTVKGRTSSKWKVRDFSTNSYSKVSYLKETLTIEDVDGDGIYESSFLYGIIPDGMDPFAMKLMMHIKDSKVAIRGTIPKTEDDLMAYEMLPDSSFDKFDSRFKEFAIAKWRKFFERYREDMNE